MGKKRFRKLEFYTPENDTEEDLVRRLEEAESLKTHAQNYYKLYHGESLSIRAKLKEFRGAKGDELQFTNHAVLRYLERVWGIDVEQAKTELTNAAPDDLPPLKGRQTISNVSKHRKGNLEFVIRDNLVLTVQTIEEVDGQ